MLMDEASHCGTPIDVIERWRILCQCTCCHNSEKLNLRLRLGPGLPQKDSQQILLICVECEVECEREGHQFLLKMYVRPGITRLSQVKPCIARNMSVSVSPTKIHGDHIIIVQKEICAVLERVCENT
jgi:hypothetical protein